MCIYIYIIYIYIHIHISEEFQTHVSRAEFDIASIYELRSGQKLIETRTKKKNDVYPYWPNYNTFKSEFHPPSI